MNLQVLRFLPISNTYIKSIYLLLRSSTNLAAFEKFERFFIYCMQNVYTYILNVTNEFKRILTLKKSWYNAFFAVKTNNIYFRVG